MSRITTDDLGMSSWEVGGLRDFGSLYLQALESADATFEKYGDGGRDPVDGAVIPRLTPRQILPQVIYQALDRARGYGVQMVFQPIGETARGLFTTPTRHDLLVDLLHDFLSANQAAYRSGEGLSYACGMNGVYCFSIAAVDRAIERIEALITPEVADG